MRTPLATLRGTLEVLIRKPRTEIEYQEKIKFALSEIDLMSESIDQLLELARFDTNLPLENNDLVSINILINDILSKNSESIKQKT